MSPSNPYAPKAQAPRARLVLENGATFQGTLFGCETATAGEVVFNTGMVGYPETFSDPSYHGQILVMTYPLIGNYGVPGPEKDPFGLPKHCESEGMHVSGIVVSEYAAWHSHYQAVMSLSDWMKDAQVVGISGIDTRALTMLLREKGSMLGKIETEESEIDFVDPMARALVPEVSCREVTRITPYENAPTVVVVDCGCKANIIRSVLTRGFNVIRVPHDEYFLNLDFDGVVISNGPGDPKTCPITVRNVEHALALGKPIFGICLGHQILSLAAGLDTYKLKFGHRGQNQPCIEYSKNGNGTVTKTKRCYITSQNHGYAVRADALTSDWQVWFENANDGTVEGIRHKTKPFFSVQFHPEAQPGPTDTAWIFDTFAEAVSEVKNEGN